jgi:hypothetical protein
LIGEHLGAYEILSELGSGGMGKVYLARNGQQVALKVLHPHFLESPEALERFKRVERLAEEAGDDDVRGQAASQRSPSTKSVSLPRSDSGRATCSGGRRATAPIWTRRSVSSTSPSRTSPSSTTRRSSRTAA